MVNNRGANKMFSSFNQVSKEEYIIPDIEIESPVLDGRTKMEINNANENYTNPDSTFGLRSCATDSETNNNINEKYFIYEDSESDTDSETETKSPKERITWNSIDWICNCCPRKFTNNVMFFEHLQSKKILNPHFNCHKKCKVNDFVDYVSFINHMRLMHHEELKHCCDVCNLIFDFEDRLQLAAHRNNHNVEEDCLIPKAFMCSECARSYLTSFALINHLQLTHFYKCRYCIKEFLGKAARDKHMETHGKEASLIDSPSAIAKMEEESIDTNDSVGTRLFLLQADVHHDIEVVVTEDRCIRMVKKFKTKPSDAPVNNARIPAFVYGTNDEDDNKAGKQLCVLQACNYGTLWCTTHGSTENCVSSLNKYNKKPYFREYVQNEHMDKLDNTARRRAKRSKTLVEKPPSGLESAANIQKSIVYDSSDDDNDSASKKLCVLQVPETEKGPSLCKSHGSIESCMKALNNGTKTVAPREQTFKSRSFEKSVANQNIAKTPPVIKSGIQNKPKIFIIPCKPSGTQCTGNQIEKYHENKTTASSTKEKQSFKRKNNSHNIYHYSKYNLSTESNKVFRCPKCSILCQDEKIFQTHLMKHVSPKDHRCIICTKNFSIFFELKTHMEEHAQEFPFPCTKCIQRFRLKANMLVHVMYRHTQPFICEICSKGLKTMSNLTEHMLSHL